MALKISKFCGVAILVVFASVSHAFPNSVVQQNKDNVPGSAGNHATVQSGQFLLTNNENYGLQISHAPYTSSSSQDEEYPQPKSTNNNPQVYCAGCWAPENLQPQSQPQRQYYSSPRKQYQEAKAVPVPFSTGHNSNVGGRYSYSVNLEGNQQQQQQPNAGWNWNTVQQPQQTPPVQVQVQAPAQGYQYQWGQNHHQQQQRAQTFNNDPVQHLQINEDGRYSFGYNAADSARQEQRNLDGTVSGYYSYTDPTGSQVQVDYRASPKEGFRAFGPSVPLQNPNPVPVEQFQIPLPVQDTPEVQAARAEFFKAYNQQLQLIEKAQAEAKVRSVDEQNQNQQNLQSNESNKVVAVHAEGREEQKKAANETEPKQNETAKGTNRNSSTDFKNLPHPIPIPDSNGSNHGAEAEEDDELENDAVVINNAEDQEPSSVPQAVNVPKSTLQAPKEQEENKENQSQESPDPSYKLSLVIGDNSVGVGQNQGSVAVPVVQNQVQPQQQQQPFVVGYQYAQGQQVPYQYQTHQPMSPVPVGASYQLSHMVGSGQDQGQYQTQSASLGYYNQYSMPQQMQQSQGVMMDPYAQSISVEAGNKIEPNQVQQTSASPGYFYYVSVGGSPTPQLVSSSNLFNSEFPTSLKAQLAGAIPQDARHDSQIPHQNMAIIQNAVGTKSNPPVYLDVDPTKMTQGYNANNGKQPVSIVGFIPGALISLRNANNGGASSSIHVNSAAISQTAGTRATLQILNSDGKVNGGQQIPFIIFQK